MRRPDTARFRLSVFPSKRIIMFHPKCVTHCITHFRGGWASLFPEVGLAGPSEPSRHRAEKSRASRAATKSAQHQDKQPATLGNPAGAAAAARAGARAGPCCHISSDAAAPGAQVRSTAAYPARAAESAETVAVAVETVPTSIDGPPRPQRQSDLPPDAKATASARTRLVGG